MDVEELARQELARGVRAAPRSTTLAILGRILFHTASLLLGIGAFVAYQHFSVAGQSTASLVSLVAAGLLVLSPVRAVLHAFFAVERRVLHVTHGLGALALTGLTLGGVVKGQPLLTHAALAPFAIMGAAQAVMHQDHPRNAAQAAALQRFATSLPEVEQFTKGDLTSTENVTRAIAVLTDLVGKAQALGETELEADPGFQNALSHMGLSLGLDAIDRAIDTLATNPAAAHAVPDLRKRVTQARKTLGR